MKCGKKILFFLQFTSICARTCAWNQRSVSGGGSQSEFSSSKLLRSQIFHISQLLVDIFFKSSSRILKNSNSIFCVMNYWTFGMLINSQFKIDSTNRVYLFTILIFMTKTILYQVMLIGLVKFSKIV